MKKKSTKFKNNLRIVLAIAWKDILDGWGSTLEELTYSLL